MNRKLLFVFLLIALLVSACGGDDKKQETSTPTPQPSKTPTSTPTPTPDPTETPPARTPQDLGKEIGALYAEALVEVIELVQDQPPADEVKPQVAALKEAYIQKLIVLGQERETFGEADKTSMNIHIRQALDELYQDKEQWQAYNDALSHYIQEDKELYDLVASFNIIGQYAQFELLIKQEPEEAVRLGILDPSEIAPTATDAPAPTEPAVVEPPPAAELDWTPGWYAYINGNNVKALA